MSEWDTTIPRSLYASSYTMRALLNLGSVRGVEENAGRLYLAERACLHVCVVFVFTKARTQTHERERRLTWYCGLYQCFRSQSHKIICKTQRDTQEKGSVNCCFTMCKTQNIIFHLHTHTKNKQGNVVCFERQVRHQLPTTSSACYLNTWHSRRLHEGFPETVRCTLRRYAATAPGDRRPSVFPSKFCFVFRYLARECNKRKAANR